MSAVELWLRENDAYDLDILLQLEQEGLNHPKKDLENVDDEAWNRIKNHIKHYRQNDTEIDRKLAKVDELFDEIRNWEDKGDTLKLDEESEDETTTEFTIPTIGKQQSVVDALLNVGTEDTNDTNDANNDTMIEKDYEDMNLSADHEDTALDTIVDDQSGGDGVASTDNDSVTDPAAANSTGPALQKVISSVLLDDDEILGQDGHEQAPQLNTGSQVNMNMMSITSADLEPVAESRGGSTNYSISQSGDMTGPMVVGQSESNIENYDMDSGAWMEEDDKLRLSDDEMSEPIPDEPREHYKAGTITSNASTVDLLMAGPEREPEPNEPDEPQEAEWKEEDDKLKLSDNEEEVTADTLEVTEHYKMSTTASTVDILMAGPEREPDWKEQDDKLNFSDDEQVENTNDTKPDGDAVGKYAAVSSHKSTVDLLMAGPDGPEADPDEQTVEVTNPNEQTKEEVTEEVEEKKVRFEEEEEEEEWKEQDDKLKFSDDEEPDLVEASSLSAAAMALRARPMKKGQSVVDMLMGVDDEETKESDIRDSVSEIKRADAMEEVASESDDDDDDDDMEDEAIADDFAVAKRRLRSASKASARDLRNARLRVQGYFNDATTACFSGLNGMSS